MLCGLSEASSATTRLALRAPVSDGAKLTAIVQLAPAASVLPQSPADWKSPAFAPVKPIEAIASAAVPVLRRVTGCDALVVPTIWPAKLSEAGDSDAAG